MQNVKVTNCRAVCYWTCLVVKVIWGSTYWYRLLTNSDVTSLSSHLHPQNPWALDFWRSESPFMLCQGVWGRSGDNKVSVFKGPCRPDSLVSLQKYRCSELFTDLLVWRQNRSFLLLPLHVFFLHFLFCFPYTDL